MPRPKRIRRGSDLPQSKLEEQDVRLIRELVAERERHKRAARELSNARLAEKFGISLRTIERLLHGETWWHV